MNRLVAGFAPFALALAALLVVPSSTRAASDASAVGRWVTIDDETKKPKSHVVIEEKGGKLVGKIVHLVSPDTPNPKCTECDGAKKDKPIVGMEIMWDLKRDKGEDKPTWHDGKIMDPKNGKTYDCKIWLEKPNELVVRGSFLFIGRSQTWYRIDDDGKRL